MFYINVKSILFFQYFVFRTPPRLLLAEAVGDAEVEHGVDFHVSRGADI